MEIDQTEQPIPPVASNRKYPFGLLKVGQSFYVEGHTTTGNVCSATYRYKQMHPGTDFTARIVSGGVRVWRTS